MEVEIRCPCCVSVETPTITSGVAYTSGDAVGGLQTLSVSVRTPGAVSAFDGTSTVEGTAILQSICVVETGNQKAALDIVLFNANPSSSTIIDNNAIVIHANDIGKIVGYAGIAASDYTTVSNASIANKTVSVVIPAAADSVTLYAAVVTTGTPTFTSTSGLKFSYGFLQN